MSALAVVELEVLRFFRRRECFWTFAIAGAVLLGSLALVLLAVRARGVSVDWRAVSEPLRVGLGLVEGLGLAVLAYALALDSLGRDREAGSSLLLRQTPLTPRAILLGKAAGLAVALLALHSFCTLPLLGYTPLVRRTHASVLAGFLGPWLVALGFIPDGFAGALARGVRRTEYLAIRGALLLRLVVPALLLQLAIRPESRSYGVDLGSIVLEYVDLRVLGTYRLGAVEVAYMGSGSVASHFVSPLAPFAILLGWQALWALVVIRWLLVRHRL